MRGILVIHCQSQIGQSAFARARQAYASIVYWRRSSDVASFARRRFVGYKFRRQVPFKNYILDFVCFEQRVVIGIDGSQHAESSRDAVRDKALREEGFKTIRYWNNDVLKRPASVLEDLLARLTAGEEDPSPRSGLRPERPSPTRGEGKRARGED